MSFSFLALEDPHRGFNLCTERDSSHTAWSSDLVTHSLLDFSIHPPHHFLTFFQSFLGMSELALCLAQPHSFSSWYFQRFTDQEDVGIFYFCFIARLLLDAVCFGFLCDLSSPSPSLFHCCVSVNYPYFIYFFWAPSVIMLLRRRHEQEATRKERWSVAQQSLPLRAQERNGGSRGWFGIRDANVEKRLELLLSFQDLGWELGSWKTGSCNPTTCHLFGSNCWPGFWAWMNFLSGRGLLSLFSLLPMAVSVL